MLSTKVYKRVFIVLVALFQISLIYAQDSIKVSSFSQSLFDLKGRTEQVMDLNGDPCALIRIACEDSLYQFEPNLGVVKRINLTGEALLYVPNGTKRMTIRHPKHIMLANYEFPEKLKGKGTYELKLTLKERNVKLCHLSIILNTSAQAEVKIDEVTISNPPYSRDVPMGTHKVFINAYGYKLASAELNVFQPEQKFRIYLTPDPNYKRNEKMREKLRAKGRINFVYFCKQKP